MDPVIYAYDTGHGYMGTEYAALMRCYVLGEGYSSIIYVSRLQL